MPIRLRLLAAAEAAEGILILLPEQVVVAVEALILK
jgi:hypothetical protein